MLPGVYSVIVPSLSVVVVVVVLEVCAQANGAATASAMLRSVFFISSFRLVFSGKRIFSPSLKVGMRLPVEIVRNDSQDWPLFMIHLFPGFHGPLFLWETTGRLIIVVRRLGSRTRQDSSRA